jgi:hypothetical protein
MKPDSCPDHFPEVRQDALRLGGDPNRQGLTHRPSTLPAKVPSSRHPRRSELKHITVTSRRFVLLEGHHSEISTTASRCHRPRSRRSAGGGGLPTPDRHCDPAGTDPAAAVVSSVGRACSSKGGSGVDVRLPTSAPSFRGWHRRRRSYLGAHAEGNPHNNRRLSLAVLALRQRTLHQPGPSWLPKRVRARLRSPPI